MYIQYIYIDTGFVLSSPNDPDGKIQYGVWPRKYRQPAPDWAPDSTDSTEIFVLLHVRNE